MRSHVKRLGIVCAIVLAVSACGTDAKNTDPDVGSSWSSIVEKANAEGSVNFYSLEPDSVLNSLKSAFEKKYPKITMNPLRMTTAEMIQRVQQADGTQGDEQAADIVSATDTSFMVSLDNSKGLLALKGPEFDNIGKLVEKYPLLQRTPNTIVSAAQPYYIVWNTDKVTKPIEDFPDLVSRADEFDGNFGSIGFVSGSVINFFSTIEEGVDKVDLVKQFKKTGEVQGGDFLKNVGSKLHPKLYDSGIPLTQAVASGELKAAWFGVGATITELKASGAPIEAKLSKIAPTSATITNGIPTSAPHPNAAEVLIDFMMSPEGQEALTKHGNIAVLSDIPGSIGDASLIKMPRDGILDEKFIEAYAQHFQAVIG